MSVQIHLLTAQDFYNLRDVMHSIGGFQVLNPYLNQGRQPIENSSRRPAINLSDDQRSR